MNNKKLWLTVIIAFVVRGLLDAQVNSFNLPDQLTTLIKNAFDNYPKLKAGDATIRSTETQHDLAKAGYLPTVDGDGTYRYQKPTPSLTFPGFGSFQFFPANNYDFHVAAQVPIWDFGRTQTDVKKTFLEIQTSRDNLESVKQTLSYQVTELYCAIVFYNKSIEVQNEQINLLDSDINIISARVKDGDALNFDLLSTQVKRNNADNQLIDLENSRKKDYEYLDMLTAQQGDGYITRDDITFDSKGHEDVSSDKNYDLLILNDQLRESEMDIKAARNNWLPKLTARGQLGYQDGYIGTKEGGGLISINQLLLTGSVGVGLTVPIYGGDRPNYRTKIAQINLEAAKYNMETTKINVDKDILQAKSDLEATKGKLKNYESQIDQAKEALNLAEIRYKAGVITNLELLTSRTDLQNAELGKIQLQFSLLLSLIDLNRMGGTKLW